MDVDKFEKIKKSHNGKCSLLIWKHMQVLVFSMSILAFTNALRCLSCNSLFNENCSETFNRTTTIFCEEEEDCVTLIDTNFTVYRGCSSEMIENVIAFRSCNNSDFCNNQRVCLENSDCIFCDDENCRDEESYYQMCIECDSSKGDNCHNIEIDRQEVVCTKSHRTGCYHYEKGTLVKRGCISHLSAHDQLYKDCENGIDCRICAGNNCNIKENLQKCYSCNSAIDKVCTTLKGELPEKLCDDYFDICKVYVKPNSTTHRGCSNEIYEPGIECSPQTVNCRECTEKLCNGGIFPASRLTCYVCNGLVTSDCSLNVKDEMIQSCEEYNFRDSCYLFMGNNNLTIRGCLSDSNFYRDSCLEKPIQCDTCQAPNCNKKSALRKPTLSCIKCDTASDPKCLWGFMESSKIPCTKAVLHYEEESCFTFKVSEKSLIRGCTLDSNICRGSKNCETCQGNACNNEKKVTQYCIECDSLIDKRCVDLPSSLKNISCNDNIIYEHRGCFTWKKENQISRGCFSKLSAVNKFECMNDRENCKICHENDACNSIPNSDSSCKSKYDFYWTLFALLFQLFLFI